ncbi:MAG TPA: hypothetical protein VL137_05900, partial [Polyangiaceae bacterium]|nr:hypothetical protein [Polyangiaceae bacterium]
MRSAGSTTLLDRAYAGFFNTILMPGWERLVRHRDTLKHLRYLEASQWLSAEERARYELIDLRQLLAYAGKHVPYYRELFRRERFDPRA